LVGVASAHQQLRAAAANITTCAVSAVLQAATPLQGGADNLATLVNFDVTAACAVVTYLDELTSTAAAAAPAVAAAPAPAAAAAAVLSVASSSAQAEALASTAATDTGLALHTAAARGDSAAVQLLLRNPKTQVDAVDADGNSELPSPVAESALHMAAEQGHASVVQLLLDAQAAVDITAEDGWTPLHRAAMKGHTAVVQLPLDAQADMNLADGVGRTPVYLAAVDGHKETVQLLLSAPELKTEALKGVARAAASYEYFETAIMVLRALMARDRLAAAAELADGASLAAEVLQRWHAAEVTAGEMAACWPALQHLLVGIGATYKQLKGSAGGITAAAVSAAVQAATETQKGQAGAKDAGRAGCRQCCCCGCRCLCLSSCSCCSSSSSSSSSSSNGGGHLTSQVLSHT
jgi:hypothetical protein